MVGIHSNFFAGMNLLSSGVAGDSTISATYSAGRICMKKAR